MEVVNITLDDIKLSREDLSLRDALVLSIAIKANFKSSSLHYNRSRNGKTCLAGMRSLFKCSNNTFKRMLSNGIKLGLIERKGNYIIAKPIRKRGAYTIALPVQKGMSFNRINKALDNVTYAYKIMCLNNASYSIKMASGAKVMSPKDIAKYRKARKFVSESERASRFLDMISYETLAKQNGVSRLQAIRDINSLVCKGTIIKDSKVSVIEDKPLNNLDLAYLNENSFGFYFNKRVDGELKLVHQEANAYELSDDLRKLFRIDWSFDKYEEYRSFCQFSKTA